MGQRVELQNLRPGGPYISPVILVAPPDNAVIVEWFQVLPGTLTLNLFDASSDNFVSPVPTVDPTGAIGAVVSSGKVIIENLLPYVRLIASVTSGAWTIYITPVPSSGQATVNAVVSGAIDVNVTEVLGAAVSSSNPVPTEITDGAGNVLGVTGKPVIVDNAWTVQPVGGNAGSGLGDSGNPVKVGGRFNTVLPTLLNGQRGDLQLDSSGRVITAPISLAGDVPANVTQVLGSAISVANPVPVEISDGTDVLGTVAHPVIVDASGTTVPTTSVNLDTTLVAPGASVAPAKLVSVAGKTNDGLPLWEPLPLGPSGRAVVVEGIAAGVPVVVGGNVAAGDADSGKPVKVGGIHLLSPPSLADGDRGDLQLDSVGNLQMIINGVTVNLPLDGVTVPGTLYVSALSQTYDGASWHRLRGNNQVLVAANIARTLSFTGADLRLYNERGIRVYWRISATAGVVSLNLTVQVKDQVSGQYVGIGSIGTVTGVSTNSLAIYPGITAPNQLSNAVGPVYRIIVNAGTGISANYSIAVDQLV